MNSFDVEKIWAEQDVDTKKVLLKEVIDNFKYTKKIPLFRKQVSEVFTVKQLDQIALNIHMAGQKLSKIK